MKIYLAGPCDTENRTTMMNIAGWLRHEPSLEVYCPWELKIEDAWHMSQENWGTQVFWKDVEAIDDCDVFLMISLGRHSKPVQIGNKDTPLQRKKSFMLFKLQKKQLL